MVGVLGAYSNQDIKVTAGQIDGLLHRARAERIERPASQELRRVRRPRSLPLATQDQIVAGYVSGKNMNELAREIGVHRVTVRKALDRAAVAVRSKGLSETQVDEARRLYEQERLSLAAIGARLGVDAGTVHARLRELGVAMRDTHGRERA